MKKQKLAATVSVGTMALFVARLTTAVTLCVTLGEMRRPPDGRM